MRNANKVKAIAIHCSAGFGDKASILAYWKNTLGWKTVGYHRLIGLNGEIYELSRFDEVTNGVANHNTETINICYIGGIEVINKEGHKTYKAKDTRTDQQKASIIYEIEQALKWLRANGVDTRKIVIKGHRDFSPDGNHDGTIESWERIKECPSFDAIPEYKHITDAEPAPAHVADQDYHVVNAGDNLTKIAQKYETTVEELRSKNALTKNSVLRIGQKILLPILIAVFMLSCSARKVNKSETHQELKVETDSSGTETANTHIETETTTDEQNDIITTETTITPIVDSIPAQYTDESGQTHKLKNAAYKKITTTDRSKAATKQKTQENEDFTASGSNKRRIGNTTNTKDKELEKKETGKTWAISSIIWASVFLLLIIIAVCWYFGAFRKKKTTNRS